MRKCRWLSSVVLVLAVVSLSAQTRRTFDVASVKKRSEPLVLRTLANPNIRRGAIFSMPSATVASLIEFVYDVRDSRIVDGPEWIREDLFEVQARAAVEVPDEELRLMVQSLLEERFKLVGRRESREMSHFELVLARSDGHLGPSLQPRECRDPATRPKRPTVPKGATTNSGCGTMSTVAQMASSWMRAPVIDKTGVAGTFDYFMFVSGEGWPLRDIARAAGMRLPEPEPGLPSFRDALRDQLGLKLESVRGPVDVVAIASVQQPSEN